MNRTHRFLAWALFLSLVVHLLLLGAAGQGWAPPAEHIPFPIEASLRLPEQAAEPSALPSPRPPSPRKEVASKAAVPLEPPPPVAEPAPAPETIALPEPAPAIATVAPEAPPPPPLPEPHAPTPPVPAEPEPPPALRQLPERMTLRYKVAAGEGGFNLGEAIYTWQRQGERYSLVSIAQASGLASLFVSGRLIQTSEGTLGRHGLQPERYWLDRNGRRQDMARFDWRNRRIVQGSEGGELHPASQDVLSFPFHLAMTVDETVREWSLWVSNGRKLREYGFRNLGHERFVLGGQEVETLHLQGGRSGEGSLDVWLAPARHWLPIRIRTLDSKGKVMVLSLEGD